MATSIGGISGVSSLLLTNERFLNVKSDYLLPLAEWIMVQNLLDVRNLIRQLLEENEIDDDFVSFLYDRDKSSTTELVQTHSAMSNFISKISQLSLQLVLERTHSISSKVSPSRTLCLDNSTYGAEPFLPLSRASTDICLHHCCFISIHKECSGYFRTNIFPSQPSFMRSVCDGVCL